MMMARGGHSATRKKQHPLSELADPARFHSGEKSSSPFAVRHNVTDGESMRAIVSLFVIVYLVSTANSVVAQYPLDDLGTADTSTGPNLSPPLYEDAASCRDVYFQADGLYWGRVGT